MPSQISISKTASGAPGKRQIWMHLEEEAAQKNCGDAVLNFERRSSMHGYLINFCDDFFILHANNKSHG